SRITQRILIRRDPLAAHYLSMSCVPNRSNTSTETRARHRRTDQRSRWKQDERRYVARPHDREVATVDCRNLVDTEPFGHGDHGGVRAAQWQVTILAHQGRHPHQVTLQQIPKGEYLAGTERVQESGLRVGA